MPRNARGRSSRSRDAKRPYVGSALSPRDLSVTFNRRGEAVAFFRRAQEMPLGGNAGGQRTRSADGGRPAVSAPLVNLVVTIPGDRRDEIVDASHEEDFS